MSDFKSFGQKVAKHFAMMSKNELYRVNVSGDDLWDTYLNSFPEGSNPMFRKRTEHDGSYDRNFIRQIGNVVAIVNGKLVSIWDAAGIAYPYAEVCSCMSAMIQNALIVDLFRTSEKKYGVVTSTERLENGSIKVWDHFHADVAIRHHSKTSGYDTGNARTTVELLSRTMNTIHPESVQTVLDLISEQALYRGAEFQAQVANFQRLQTEFNKKTKDDDIFLWETGINAPSARIKNTAIGSLMIDLSEGMELEKAVKSFESKIAPQNYKRPTALITQSMVKNAMKTIQEMNLEDALTRRHARVSDLTVNNVLWGNNSTSSKMKSGIESLLSTVVVEKTPKRNVVEEISIEDFISKVLPKAWTISAYMGNKYQGNLVSLTAPVHDGVESLFQWDNNFGWSYNGNITDSIKERVKAAGGATDADLRVSLAWFNGDDLDLHSNSPYGYTYYGSPSGDSYGVKRILDVDMNAGITVNSIDPVENQAFNKPRDGQYVISVNQFYQRTGENPGFELQVECGGTTHMFSYKKTVKGTIKCLSFDMKAGVLSNMKALTGDVSSTTASKTVWGIQTEKFVEVDTILLSPNHWDDNAKGNKHWFFILEGCRNPDQTRGIYNEFLNNNLTKHRKVFEVLGSKTMCPYTEEQLSGIGFSSTKDAELMVRVVGSSYNKTFMVKFT